MNSIFSRLIATSFVFALSLALLGCASSTVSRAPVEERVGANKSSASTSMPPVAKAPVALAVVAKTGTYIVKPGDTLVRIGLDTGHNWRDLARWNQIDSPSRIEVGQVIRLSPPEATVVTTPVPALPNLIPITSITLPPAVKPAVVVGMPPMDTLNWMWPTTAGQVTAGFDEIKNKGLDISGNTGESVLAAFDGRVVYAGSGLRGYGNLVILKHNDTYLSAYAHNQTLLVKEDQLVTKGQKIAEMGQTDSDSVKLHFEIRKQGKPVDPLLHLPKR
jgi:lipoprotein NlpD